MPTVPQQIAAVVAEESAAWRARIARAEAERHARPPVDPSYFNSIPTPSEATPVAKSVKACPWDAQVTADEHGALTFQFTRPGALRPAGMPGNMFDGGALWKTALGSDPTYIILSCATDGNTVTSSEIITRDSPAAPIGIQESTAPASFEIDLYAIVGGAAFKVIECTNPQAFAVVALITDKEDPVCAGDPLVRHYTWSINPTLSS